VDEFQLISRYFAPLAAAEPGALRLGDDAAVLALPPHRDLVVTTDMLIEGVHFRADDPPQSVGVKALAVNLSDMAAMGAMPRAYVLALALPAAWPETQRGSWLASFTAGLAETQDAFEMPLAGGDTVATPGPLSISITAFGLAPKEGAMLRSGARPGDEIWISGTIGDGALGLRVLSGALALGDPELEAALVERYQRPRPRLALGRALAGLAHSCADVSDGLIADLGHICETSSVIAAVDAERLPLSTAACVAIERYPELWGCVLSGGDDYELIFTAAAVDSAAIERVAGTVGTSVSNIGRIGELQTAVTASPVTVRAADGRTLPPAGRGWSHF
jgi:thiamine-monophosphate kinase